MPSCGHLLATDPFRTSPASVALIFLPPSTDPVHKQIMSPSPYCLASSVMMSYEVLSKAPSLSRKAPSVNFPVFHCFLHMCDHVNAVWLQWTSLVSRQVGINVGDIAPKSPL